MLLLKIIIKKKAAVSSVFVLVNGFVIKRGVSLSSFPTRLIIKVPPAGYELNHVTERKWKPRQAL